MSISRYSSEIKVLNEEKKRLLIPIEKKKDLLDKIKKVNEKIDYLEETLAIGQKNLLTVLYGISSLRPNDIVLTKISQNEAAASRLKAMPFRDALLPISAINSLL
jgi:hypothetical protein